MNIRSISREGIEGFVGCYLEIWKSLRGVLPDGYVEDQIRRASSQELQEKVFEDVSDPSYLHLVAVNGGETIGLAWGDLREDGSSWLSFLGVLPAQRRRGVGRSLLARFIEDSRKKGSHKVSLDTDPCLVPAVRLYESMGFVAGGFVKNAYGLELVIYSKDIT
jgi:ribosomal protein S18 acetylase RimI-like enzyme